VAVIKELVRAQTFKIGERTGLLLTDNAEAVILRYALVLRNSGELFFPQSLLDDWGHEVNGLELYEWIQENGMLFPRAELFGCELSGNPCQHFMRDVDLVAPVYCFVFKEPGSPLSAGVQVDVILVPDSQATRPISRKHLPEVKGPLRHSRVSWWRIPTHTFDETNIEKIAQVIDLETLLDDGDS